MIPPTEINKWEFLEKSNYRQVKASDYLKALLSIYSNPIKGMVILATPSCPATTSDIERNLNIQLFRCESFLLREQREELKRNGILPISTIRKHLASIYKSSRFIEKNREDKLRYRKTIDGAVIGELIAFETIRTSNDLGLGATTSEILSNPTRYGYSSLFTILFLLHLHKEKIYQNLKPVREIIEDIYGLDNDKLYYRFHKAIRKLERAGLIRSIRRNSGYKHYYLTDEILSSLDINSLIPKLKEKYSLSSLYIFKKYVKPILKYLERNSYTSIGIAARLGIPEDSAQTVLGMLRRLGVVDLAESAHAISLTEKGKNFVSKHLIPLLEKLDIYPALEGNLTYPATQKEIRIDLESVYGVWREDVYYLFKNPKEFKDFQEICIEVRKRYQKEKCKDKKEHLVNYLYT